MNLTYPKGTQTVLFHLFVLSLALVIDLPNFGMIKSWGDLAYYFLSRVFLLIAFYTNYCWLVPRYLANKRIIAFVAILIGVIALTTFIGVFSLQIAHSFIKEEQLIIHYNIHMQLSGMIALFVASAFGIMFRVLTSWYDEMQHRSILEKEKLKSELSLLKAQVNPHFLFNTLNNIDTLISSDQAKASESLIKLSSLLRYVIYDTVEEMVPLQKEIEQIRAYIDLQSLRYNTRSSIQFELYGEAGSKMVAPMLFIPFIENAFKHSGSAGVMQGISIRLSIHEDEIEFVCHNHIASSLTTNESGGFGLENIKKRLNLQYPDCHELIIEQTNDSFLISLKIVLA
jgi:sensor histidine kinase YesM